MTKTIIGSKCTNCGCDLWFEEFQHYVDIRNYYYFKGKYFCKNCRFKKT